jgi:hypothetical protein
MGAYCPSSQCAPTVGGMLLLHCALLVVRAGVLYCTVVGKDSRTPLLRCARPHRCAWLCCARKRAVCIVAEGDPEPLLSFSFCYSSTYHNSAISMRRRIMFPYSEIHPRATLRACGA